MTWTRAVKRKPKTSGFYFWKGKSGYGGMEYFNAEIGNFELNQDIPANKRDEESLYWLDEENIKYED